MDNLMQAILLFTFLSFSLLIGMISIILYIKHENKKGQNKKGQKERSIRKDDLFHRYSY